MALKFKRCAGGLDTGHGEGRAKVDKVVYYCPCGEGEVVSMKEDIPEGVQYTWLIRCEGCAQSHGFVDGDFRKIEQ